MADEKKILVVDDHFEMLEFLRSMLELSNEDYEVLAVPSAEEGLLELRRMHFDLVITDVRLPGMSGFDLVRRTKAIKSTTPIIMITAYSSAQGKKEAEELGVFRYFPKPLDTDEMLTAVHKALYGESVVFSKPKTVTRMASDTAVPNRARKRLESLRTDTGAAQLALSNVAGQVVLQVGNDRIADSTKLIAILAQNIKDSFLLAQELETQEPFTIQYHAGGRVELYVMNVGRDYFLAMFFDVQARRGRIGTIWVFAQRAIKELLALLPPTMAGAEPEKALRPLEETGALAETAVSQPKPSPRDEPVEPEGEIEDWPDVAPEELANLLASEADFPTDTGDLNMFWDNALAEADATSATGGFSWEEARRQGLIATDLANEEGGRMKDEG